MRTMMSKVDLHDATLLAVHICWKNGTCVVDMRHGELGACTLTFSAISHLTLPRRQSWGPSASINAFVQRSSGQYEIEMQSGDAIEIEAANVVFAASGGSASFPRDFE